METLIIIFGVLWFLDRWSENVKNKRIQIAKENRELQVIQRLEIMIEHLNALTDWEAHKQWEANWLERQAEKLELENRNRPFVAPEEISEILARQKEQTAMPSSKRPASAAQEVAKREAAERAELAAQFRRAGGQ
jgi:hypothetical protein